jgi:nucleotide-binding universal stress UspA family protein
MQSTTMTPPGARPSVAGYGPASARVASPLLVAIAGGDATAILTAARLLAERLDGAPEIVAVNELVPIHPAPDSMDALPPELYAAQRRRLQDAVLRSVHAAHDVGLTWPLDVVDGQPARTIARLARERRVRMIVMGIGRHTPMDRIFGSETALQTLRVADRPVLAVAPGFAALPRRAVVAVDFSPASVRAAEEALALLAGGGTLSLVYVRPPADVLLRLGDETLSWMHGERVTELFARLVAALDVPPSVSVEPQVLAGDPADQLLDLAERQGADLIATGSSGLGFFNRLIVGSVATRLLRRATVSVLAVPRPSAADVERIERLLSSTTESSEAARWPALVEEFSQRNMGRPTQLEIDDPALGAQFQEVGHVLLGASYDRRDGRLEIMLGAPAGGDGRLTHGIGDVTSIAVLAGPHRRDLALQARHGQGQTILMFRD